MNSLRCLVAVAAPVLLLSGQRLEAAKFHFAHQTLTVPDGFTVEQVAGPPLVLRPISAAFDEAGRLYVTDSSGSNDPVKKQLAEKPHRVLRLVDEDGDGIFDHSTVYANRMMFPEGAMWYHGSLYMAAPPSIWKLTDTTGDGVADQREEWFQGKTLTGCANDLHGPYLGLDGWIYWCKGAFAQQTYLRPGRPPFVTRAAHIFRARPDASAIEPVLTGGMDNPVSVTFTPGGERLLVGTFFHHPAEGKRDGIIHAIYGGVYGKEHDVIEGHKRTGGLMPVMTELGAAAPCSIIRYRSAVFGPEYRDNYFTCLFNLRKVMRHILVPTGATFRTKDSDFVTSDSPDFHPTAVVEDADGSLLVVDTGGWYKLCCPTSQLYKPDVLGAIYRIRRVGASHISDPRGLALKWHGLPPRTLADLLGDPRPAVRSRAIDELGRRGDRAVRALASAVSSGSPTRRRNAVWALTRIESDSARAAVRIALGDPEESVRHAAIQSVAVWRDAGALPALLRLVNRDAPPIQRAAAEALGRIGAARAVPALLRAAAVPHDRVLEHSLTYALIEIDQPAATEPGLQASSPSTRRAALVALDQMDRGGLKPAQVTPFLTDADHRMRATALWVAGHHPEWASDLAGFFDGQLHTLAAGKDAHELETSLAGFAGQPAIQTLLAGVVSASADPLSSRKAALEAMRQSALQALPQLWVQALTTVLEPRSGPLVKTALAVLGTLPAPQHDAAALVEVLHSIGADRRVASSLRLQALAAVPGGMKSVGTPVFNFLCTQVSAGASVGDRMAATSVLAEATLTDSQRTKLLETLRTAGPLEFTKLLAVFEKNPAEALGFRLVEALQSAKSRTSLRAASLETLLQKYPASVQAQAQELRQQLTVDTGKQQARLAHLLATLPTGDVRRGQAVFQSAKVACSSCHEIGYLGGHVGPDLTHIGRTRTRRDLLEAVLYPSASFVRSFEPMQVLTKDGDEFTGIVRRDAPDAVVLVTGPGTQVRIPREQITDLRPGTVSVMPSGLADALTPTELADLLAFLQSRR